MLLTIGIIIVWVLAVVVILRVARFGSDESYGERVEREREVRRLKNE